MTKLSIFYPVNPMIITQGWGVNGEYYRANKINVAGHNGEDLLAYHGQPVYAAHDGIAYYETDTKGGQGVVILSDKPYDYKGKQCYYKSIYWHLCDPKETKYKSPVYVALGSKANTGKGTPVKAGDLIGYADNTGLSSGDHLHFGFKPCIPGDGTGTGDPSDISDFVNIEQSNGYLGAIDPTPYWNGQYAEDAAKRIDSLTLQVGILTKIVELLKRLYSK